jgi:hypothetical protein
MLKFYSKNNLCILDYLKASDLQINRLKIDYVPKEYIPGISEYFDLLGGYCSIMDHVLKYFDPLFFDNDHYNMTKLDSLSENIEEWNAFITEKFNNGSIYSLINSVKEYIFKYILEDMTNYLLDNNLKEIGNVSASLFQVRVRDDGWNQYYKDFFSKERTNADDHFNGGVLSYYECIGGECDAMNLIFESVTFNYDKGVKNEKISKIPIVIQWNKFLDEYFMLLL